MTTRINSDATGYQSPPKLVTLDDGRTLYVWINDAITDDSTSAEIQVRIYTTDGTPASAQINLSSLAAVDNDDGFDWDNLDVDLLPDGKVMLSYVISGGVAGSGNEAPVFAIIEPTADSVTIAQQTTFIPQVNNFDGSIYKSPPITTVLDDGNVLFVWSENALSDNTTVDLNGRIYNPDTNTFGNEFPVGNVAVDGTDTVDVPNMEIVQLASGEVVVSYVRNDAEAGGSEPVFTILDSSGNTLLQSTEFQQNDTTTDESPALVTALDDGNFMGVWIKNGYSDDSTSMTLQGRIFDSSGNAVTDELTLNGSGFSVDGSNDYDLPNFTIDTLGSDLIVVSYVDSTVNDDGFGGNNSSDKAYFSILDVSDPAAPTFVAQDVQIPLNPNYGYGGPALIEALGDSGSFVAIYSDGNAASGGPM